MAKNSKAQPGLKGAQFSPDIKSFPSEVLRSEVRVWLGLLPDCPVDQLDVAGLTFVKASQWLVTDPQNPGGRKARIPHNGDIGLMDGGRLEEFRERLSRTIIRNLGTKPQQQEPGTGENTGDPFHRGRKGLVITIPTAEEVAARRAKGLPENTYTKRPGDEPAARYVYIQVCEDQRAGEPGRVLPDPLEVTGLTLPGADTGDAVDDFTS